MVIFAASQVGAREDVNFDFAWRFALGDMGTAVHCSADAFPQNLSMVECLGLRSNSATNADDCLDACCGDEMCAIWQYASNKGCWIGQSSDCKHPNNDWVGGGRNTPAPPLPPAKTGPISRDYDDSSWELVDAPHDGIITGTYSETGPKSHGYLPTNITWYRKHFKLPSDWGQSIWVYFEGIFRASTTYLNGQQLLYHESGYTSFSVRLDNASTVYYGDGKDNENVLVVRTDATSGSGWWYEGGGIYRHNHLVSTSHVHLMVDGVYGPSYITGKISPHDQNDLSKGLIAEAVTMFPTADVINDDTNGNSPSVMVRFTLYNEDGASVTSGDTSSMTIAGGKTVMLNGTIRLTNAEVWSNTRTYLYTLQAEVMSGSTVMDAVNVSVGIRSTRWDADNGFYLNDMHFTWRGFNNHNDFTGVGAAIPDRVNLFRGQMMRAVGANSWRMSHNPPIPVMLDILDRLGIIVWDENRNFGNNTNWVECQRDMVKRDRNHPSVVVWSFCNEGGCYPKDNGPIGKMFRDACYSIDPYRPVSANMFSYANLSEQIDVQGFSHRGGGNFDSYHSDYPKKPLIGSECCSCQTQRGEDVGGNTTFKSFYAQCSESQTRAELDRQFVAGCMVWTLFDYYGEPSYGWPHVSCSFGQIDLAGFAKAQAYWYRAWWLYSAKVNKTTGGNDVPLNVPPLLNPDTNSIEKTSLVHIVEHWEPQDSDSSRTIHVFTNAPKAELFVNGQSQGVQELTWEGYAEWDSINFVAGTIAAIAMSDSGDVIATHSRMTGGTAAKVVATIDVPNKVTGTGSALVLDGQDAGMVGVKVVDAQGNVVHSSSHNVTFQIVSGPGRIIGVGNGDPTCHEPNQASWRSAYHGLARAIIQVTEDHASSPKHRHRLLQIDSEGGHRTRIRAPGVFSAAPDGIVVEASVEGLGSSTVTIPVSTDAVNDGVLSAAKRWMK